MWLSVARFTIHASDEKADLLGCSDGKGLFAGLGC